MVGPGEVEAEAGGDERAGGKAAHPPGRLQRRGGHVTLADAEHHRRRREPRRPPLPERLRGAELAGRLVDVDAGRLAGAEGRADVVDALRAEQ